nr:hypothetical protein [Tanacetum cinerariifolium]
MLQQSGRHLKNRRRVRYGPWSPSWWGWLLRYG